MTIEMECRCDVQIIRFTSDSVTESDGTAILSTIELALSRGIGNILFSVEMGSLSNQLVISRLLLQCSEMLRRRKGRLQFVEKCRGEKSVFRTICDSLHIPIYESEEKFAEKVTMAGNVI